MPPGTLAPQVRAFPTGARGDWPLEKSRRMQHASGGAGVAVQAGLFMLLPMHNELTQILRCPEDRSVLSLADPELVTRLNSAIRAGRLRNRRGQTVEAPLDGGLVRAAGDLLYPIVDEIPVLLQDEAIPLDRVP